MYYRLNKNEHEIIREILPIVEKYVANTTDHGMALERLHKFQKKQNQQAC